VTGPRNSTVLAMLASLAFAAPSPGALVCGTCHPRETAAYLASPMGQSLGPPSAVPAGRVVHARSESTITIERRGNEMVHRLSERGLTAEYPIAYQIGAGRLAYSYIVELKGYLFESPATWFRSYGWDVSPGYGSAAAIDFDRPINQTCLYCHAGTVSFAGRDGRRLARPSLTAITCERCHGPFENHVRRPAAANILNPEKLPPRARDSICEQCHLEGEVRMLNPGKSWRDFHPGENLERTIAVYVLHQNGHEVTAVSQVEQLAQSRCAAASGGKLWCGSCHDPHGARAVRAVCQSCHPSLSKASHPAAAPDCVSCHMPRVSTNYAHVAVTDHRILRRPAPTNAEDGLKSLTSWVEPPAEVRRRNLVLANLTAGTKQRMPDLIRAGLELLNAVPRSQYDNDPDLLSAACEATDTVALCSRAAEVQPASADRAMALGVALARAGDLAAAEAQLRNAIRLDPGLKHAYVELWTLYDRQKRAAEMVEVADRFLKWNPQNIMFRVLKAEIAAESPRPRFW